MMTRKAHALGMSRTLYRNASGLPNDEQITTARDLTILARATEERFPRYFKYFSTHEFDYGGEIIGNHNHLLGRVDGVDGIKTGYTRASGFNLLTSVHRDGRSLVAVVLGGRTAAARDAYMEGLIRDHFAQASDRGHTAPMIAEAAAPPAPPVKLASLAIPPGAIPAPPARSAAGPIEEGDEDSAEEAPPRRAAAPVVAPVATKSAAVAPAAKPVVPIAAAPAAPRPAPTAVAAATPQQLGWVKGPDPVAKGPSRDVAPAAAPRPKPKRRPQSPPRPRPRRPIMAAGSSRSASRTTPPRPTTCSPARAPRTTGSSPRRGRSPRKSPRERTSSTAPASLASTRRAPRPPAARSRRAASPVSPRATEERHPCRSRTSLASLTCAAKAVDPPWSG